MTTPRIFRSDNWHGFIFIAAGMAMMMLWIIFTIVHGPTSFNRAGSVFGRSMFFWGSLLGGLPNLLLVLGLLGARGWLGAGISAMSKIGFVLTLIGILIPAVIDLTTGSLGPPLFVPLVGVGLLLLAAGRHRDCKRRIRQTYLLAGLGLLQLMAMAWVFLPRHLSDEFYGFRIYGVLAHFLFGAGWILIGSTIITEHSGSATANRNRLGL
jgi:hypothetical protein